MYVHVVQLYFITQHPPASRDCVTTSPHFAVTSHQLHSNFTVTSRQLHTNFTQLHIRVKTSEGSGPAPSIVPRPRASRACSFVCAAVSSLSSLTRSSRLRRNFQRTSRPLHGHFTGTSRELRHHFTQTSHELHKLHITSQSLSR